MIIVYKTSLFTYLIVKKLITLDKIGMANILLGDKIIPELIQDDVNEDKIVSAADKILSDKAAYEALKERLKAVREKLGESGASERAANIIYQFINEA
jgi:lipid-A-disaccharide synthase